MTPVSLRVVRREESVPVNGVNALMGVSLERRFYLPVSTAAQLNAVLEALRVHEIAPAVRHEEEGYIALVTTPQHFEALCDLMSSFVSSAMAGAGVS